MLKTLAVVLLASLAAAGSARAEVRVGRASVGSIQLSGPAVMYDDEIFKTESVDVVDYVDRIVRRRPGHRAKVLATPASSLDSNDESGDDDLRWDASSKALLTGVGSTNYFAADVTMGARIRGGLLGRKPFTFSHCYENATHTPVVSVWETTAAYTNTCGAGRLLVRDLAHPERDPLLKRDIDDNAVDIAGDYVAFVHYEGSKAGVAVYDWRSGTPLYTVVADLWADEYSAGTFEVQPDGKLAAVLVGRGDTCEAAWYSPAAPTAHVVGPTACGADIRLRSDRLAWMRVGKRSGELVVTPLGGAGRSIARFPAVPPTIRGERYSDTTAGQSFAWDGRRLAYAIARCDGRYDLLLRRSIAGPVRRDRAPLRCPLRVVSRTLGVKRGGASVRLPLRCPRGCAGTLDIRRSSTRQETISQPFALGRHATGARLFLEQRTRDALARRGTARVRVWIDVSGRLIGDRHDVRYRLYTR
jgi:hypothetical protein